jgi:hypothetical protein
VPEEEPASDQTRELKTARGARYILCDFFLHFYFSVLHPMEQEIRANTAGGLLFPSEILQGDAKEYIPTFTGKAFERFVFHHVNIAMRDGEWAPPGAGGVGGVFVRPLLWQLLDLADPNYHVRWNVLVRGETSDRIRSQIDVLVVHEKEKSVRVIECKWKGSGETSDIDEVKKKILPRRYEGYARRDFLVVSYEPTAQLTTSAKDAGVTLITLAAFL